MAINTETLYRKLYDNLESQGFRPHAENATTGKDVVPEEADFLEFDFDTGDGTIPVTVSVEKKNDRYNLTVYFTDDAAEKNEDEWYDVLRKLRYTSQLSGIRGFTTKNRNHLQPDMQKREYMKKQEQIAEGYHPMGKKASYNDAIPSVKIVIEHTRQIGEGEQRFRNINRIFLENEQGERILAPTTRPGIAKVYARVIAEGDLPHGDRWNHVNSMVEEYSKMAGFVRATKGKQFNESTLKLVESGIAHYNALRETLGKMTGSRGYNAYFESWTPPLMEDDTDTSNLNELFVQETLDPRIESVMPILSKLQKSISEMSEVSELAEWADSLLEAPGAETLSHNQSTEKNNLKAFDLAEEDEAELEPAVDELDECDGPSVTAQKNSSSPAMRGSPAMAHYAAQLDGELEEGDGGQEALNPVGIPEEVDTGEADARKSVKSEPKGDWDKDFRERLKQFAKDLDKEKDVEEGQQWPDTSNSLAKRKPVAAFNNVGVKAGRPGGMTVATRVDPSITSTSVKKLGSDKHIPSFLKKEEDLEEGEFAGDFKTGPEGQWRNKGPKANKPAKVGDLVGASESEETDEEAITESESEGRPYVCVHAKKGQCNVTANSSYEAAQKAAKKWGLKGTAGIDAHVADKPKDAASLEESKEGQEALEAMLRIVNR